jgi:hypothetical protein
LISFASASLTYGGLEDSERCVVANRYSNNWKPGCQWKIYVDDDRIVGGNRRMIVATSEHITGSGEWDVVMVFDCKDGHVAVAFADESQGLSVDEATASTLALTYQGDERLIFKWHPTRHDYEFVRGRRLM